MGGRGLGSLRPASIGNDDDTPMPGVTGNDLPARIWQAFMAEATGVVPLDLGAICPIEAVDTPPPLVRVAPLRRAGGIGKGRGQKAKGRGKAKGKKN